MKRIWFRKIIPIVLLTLLAAWIDLPLPRPDIGRKFDLVLGLDLAGGSHLVFEADTSKLPSEKKKTGVESARDVIERRINLFGVSEPSVRTSSFEDRDRIIVELPGVKDTREAISLIGKTAQLVFAEVGQATDSAEFKQTDLGGADLTDARVTFDKTTGKPAVSIEFTKEGASKFASITEKNVGKPLAILLDETLVSAPTVQEKISGGSANITGNFTLDQAKTLAIQLNAGALPISIKLVEERTVGATLGVESIEKSIKAGLVGLIMVLVFMFLSYGRMGIVADLGLAIFGILTLSIYKLIPVVLTLPGIAGFLLSVGMAVDSNILIFERFKEEKDKRPQGEALEVSFGRAWDSIRDANIATLVTAFILSNPFDWAFLHTSGPVRGFAITLALGIGISLFTGIFVSRNLLRVFIK
ncbi:protein translocase subunit SecD [Candidatus Woesebacteria bacterium]|nr:protein translocase subunit SecD [Candidatus Woesebacteria bacterium]